MIEKLLEDDSLRAIYEQLIAHDIFDIERTQRLILHIHDRVDAKYVMQMVLEQNAHNLPVLYETTLQIEKFYCNPNPPIPSNRSKSHRSFRSLFRQSPSIHTFGSWDEYEECQTSIVNSIEYPELPEHDVVVELDQFCSQANSCKQRRPIKKEDDDY